MKLKFLVGSGRKIGMLALPFFLAGLAMNVLFPAWFSVGGPGFALKLISIIMLIPGIVIWIWSVALIFARVPRRKLITSGPYALVKHPLYNLVPWLVFPWAGFLLNSWLGVLVAIVFYIGSRIYAPEEEKIVAKLFGAEWDQYCQKVKLPWL